MCAVFSMIRQQGPLAERSVKPMLLGYEFDNPYVVTSLCEPTISALQQNPVPLTQHMLISHLLNLGGF